VVDDLLVYRLEPDRYMLVVNAGNIEKDFAWIARHNTFDATVKDISAETALIALQGPRAIEILQPLAGRDLSSVPYYHFAPGTGCGCGRNSFSNRVYRRGRLRDLRSAEHAEAIWNRILDAGRAHGLLPAGLGARNTLRLEAKMLLYGNDMDETTTLLEAGLGWITQFDKGSFVGRDALEEQRRNGVQRVLVGFQMAGREIARQGYPVFVSGQEAGRVTSGSPSITLQKNIGLAYLPADCRKVGTTFEVGVRGRRVQAEIVATPFYKRRLI
jgi:aminomethyltransferase